MRPRALRLTATAQHTEGRVDDASPDFVATAFNQRDEDIFSGKVDYTPSDQVQFFAKGYFHDWRSHYTEFDNDLDAPGTLDVIDNHDFWGFKDYGANAAVKLALNRGFEYYLGTDYQAYSGRDAVLVITQKSENVHAFFGQVATTSDLLPNANFAAGFRYNDPSVGPSATVWNLSGKFDLPAGLYVRAQAGTAFRLPTAEELFANDPDDERGDPNLKPERSRNFNLSLGGTLLDPHLKWEVTAFYRDITDLISFDGFDDETDQSLAQNIPGTVRIRGGEFTLDASITADLSATASYTYNHAHEDGDQQIARVPVQQAKAMLDYHPRTCRSCLGRSQLCGQRVSVRSGTASRSTAGTQWWISPHATISTAVVITASRRGWKTPSTSNTPARSAPGERDSDGSNYTYWNRGVPRTFQLRYNYQF